MYHGFIKTAAATPHISVANPMKNAREIIALINQAYESGVSIVVFPELAVTACTCGDLLSLDSLLNSAEEALFEIICSTNNKKIVAVVGAPARVRGKLYNTAAVICDGKLLGLVPKSTLPNYADSYELRLFAVPPEENCRIKIANQDTVFGKNQVFSCENVRNLKLSVEFFADEHFSGKDSGATVTACPASDGETVGRADYRRLLMKSASAEKISAYIYSGADDGESTTDAVCSAHSFVADNGKIIAENKPFEKKFGEGAILTAVIDVEHLAHDRCKNNTYPAQKPEGYDVTVFSLDVKGTDITGKINPYPFTPSENEDEVYENILKTQSYGLAKRIKAAHSEGTVTALSGGLDSTLALIVASRAAEILGMEKKSVTTVTMPCFGTTSRTRSNADLMAYSLSTDHRAIDIKEAVSLHFRDIGHDPENHSVVYENAQARERTQIIMDIANAENKLVVGTGDLSELALGWATYNGDQMSNYGVNASIPKTLVRKLVEYSARQSEETNPGLARALEDILSTPVSPELLPPKDGEISQKTEDIVGPYELHDFCLYHLIRYGEAPEKILREANSAFAGKFAPEIIEKWLRIFIRRFYTQQFKRSAMPDGPKVGTVALSPRGDWKMPSDAEI